MAEEEPKYVLSFRSPNICSEKEVSTAQVQFWPEYVERMEREVVRVDLLTNEYHPRHVARLDKNGHGPLLDKALDVLS